MFSRFIITPIVSLFLALGTLSAQDLTLNIQPGSELSVDGTSNVRDWSAVTNSITAELVLNGSDEEAIQNLRPETFKSLTLTLPVTSLDSGTRGLTNNMHDYLKKNDHPNIRFELNRIREVSQNGDTYTLVADGEVTAAGVSHDVTMDVKAEQNGEGVWIFSGSKELKMTNFGIKPPTAVFGTVRAVDDFTVNYRVRFQ